MLGCVCTGIRVPVVLVMRAVLFADELLVHDFFELDHVGDVVYAVLEGGFGGFEGAIDGS